MGLVGIGVYGLEVCRGGVYLDAIVDDGMGFVAMGRAYCAIKVGVLLLLLLEKRPVSYDRRCFFGYCACDSFNPVVVATCWFSDVGLDRCCL